ncbi:TPA: hypothetical protein U2M01_000139 [Enterobacter chengduensis]|nr:hypothetical protein [Enterobacter chengduensis]
MRLQRHLSAFSVLRPSLSLLLLSKNQRLSLLLRQHLQTLRKSQFPYLLALHHHLQALYKNQQLRQRLWSCLQ